MRLLIDMNLTPRWTTTLTAAGHQATHWIDAGVPDADDRDILALARREGSIVLTADLDFGDILAASRESQPSVVILRSHDTRPEVVGSELLSALATCETELQSGALLMLTHGRRRVRLLPIY